MRFNERQEHPAPALVRRSRGHPRAHATARHRYTSGVRSGVYLDGVSAVALSAHAVGCLLAIPMTVIPQQEGRSFMPARQRNGGPVTADARYFDNVESIRASLEEIATLATYVRKWT